MPRSRNPPVFGQRSLERQKGQRTIDGVIACCEGNAIEFVLFAVSACDDALLGEVINWIVFDLNDFDIFLVHRLVEVLLQLRKSQDDSMSRRRALHLFFSCQRGEAL
jgi:hypothetical protein